MLGIGSFIAGWVSYGTFVGLHTTAQWRVPLGIQMIPAVGLGITMFRSYLDTLLTHSLRSIDILVS